LIIFLCSAILFSKTLPKIPAKKIESAAIGKKITILESGKSKKKKPAKA
jgi:hypothetical protein